MDDIAKFIMSPNLSSYLPTVVMLFVGIHIVNETIPFEML